MGYSLNSIAELPIEPDINFYIFMLGSHGYHGTLYDIIDKNFFKLASSIGQDAIIVKGLNETYFPDEIKRKYFGLMYKDFWNLGAFLLITDSHPENLSDNSFRLFVPLEEVQKRFGSFDLFFSLLVRFVKREGDEFLEKFQKIDNVVDSGLDIVELKPNLFGFGLNINELLRRLLNKLRK